MANQYKFGDVTLPENWYDLGGTEKVAYFNQQGFTPSQLLGAGAGITQSDIDFFRQHMGYSVYDPVAAPAPTPAPPAPTEAPAPIPPAAPAQSVAFEREQPGLAIEAEPYYDPYAYQDNYSYQDLIADITPTPAPTAAPAAAPAPTAAPAAWEPLAAQIASQWQGYGINPDVQGINRANELAQILANYGISDLSKIGVKETPYEEMVNAVTGEGGQDSWSTVTRNRGQLTYGDQTFGRLGGFGSGGEREFSAPQEYLQQSDPGRYGLGYSAAGKGWTEFEVVKDASGKAFKCWLLLGIFLLRGYLLRWPLHSAQLALTLPRKR
jgi:hypothetical protein